MCRHFYETLVCTFVQFVFCTRGIKYQEPTLAYFLAPTKPLQSYEQASPHPRYSVSEEQRDGMKEPSTGVVSGGGRGKDDRKQNTLAPLLYSLYRSHPHTLSPSNISSALIPRHHSDNFDDFVRRLAFAQASSYYVGGIDQNSLQRRHFQLVAENNCCVNFAGALILTLSWSLEAIEIQYNLVLTIVKVTSHESLTTNSHDHQSITKVSLLNIQLEKFSRKWLRK